MMMFDGRCTLTPAYDLTLSAGPGGEHSLAVGGEGRDPEHKHVMAVAADALISKGDATAIFDQVRSAVRNWSSYAEKAGLSGRRTTALNSLLNRSGYDEIGRASGGERVCQYVYIWVVSVS